jgi:hypothetical protein
VKVQAFLGKVAADAERAKVREARVYFMVNEWKVENESCSERIFGLAEVCRR